MILGTRSVVESQIGTGAQIEVAEAVAGKNEVVDTHDIETVGIPTEVQFTEVGTEAVLIGEFATVPDTGADGSRLRGSHDGKAEDGRDQNQSLFHNTEDLIGEISYLTMPLKPMKARARMPTLTRAIGTPLKALGTSFMARCSRMPAKMTIARP